MNCRNCKYQWQSKKQNPKECPRCKVRLDRGLTNSDKRMTQHAIDLTPFDQEERDFIIEAAKKLKFVPKIEFDIRAKELYQYAEENKYRPECAEIAIKEAMRQKTEWLAGNKQ